MTSNYLTPNVSSAAAKKLWARLTNFQPTVDMRTKKWLWFETSEFGVGLQCSVIGNGRYNGKCENHALWGRLINDFSQLNFLISLLALGPSHVLWQRMTLLISSHPDHLLSYHPRTTPTPGEGGHHLQPQRVFLQASCHPLSCLWKPLMTVCLPRPVPSLLCHIQLSKWFLQLVMNTHFLLFFPFVLFCFFP